MCPVHNIIMAKKDYRELIEDDGWIEASFIIEVQGNDKDYVKTALENLVEKMKKENQVKIIATQFDEAKKMEGEDTKQMKGDFFSINGEVKLVARDYGRLAHCATLYSPSFVEILNPKDKITIDIGEAQSSLMDIASIVAQFAQTVFIQRGVIENLQKNQNTGK